MLANHLFALQLPEYEHSFVAMEAFKRRRNLLEGRVRGTEFMALVYEHQSASFEETSLSYVRTVCVLAAREGKGVLWGNDVACEVFAVRQSGLEPENKRFSDPVFLTLQQNQ